MTSNTTTRPQPPYCVTGPLRNWRQSSPADWISTPPSLAGRFVNPELGELSEVIGFAGVGEDARVDPRMQRLDAPLQALWEAGEVLDLGDGQAQRINEGC